MQTAGHFAFLIKNQTGGLGHSENLRIKLRSDPHLSGACRFALRATPGVP